MPRSQAMLAETQVIHDTTSIYESCNGSKRFVDLMLSSVRPFIFRLPLRLGNSRKSIVTMSDNSFNPPYYAWPVEELQLEIGGVYFERGIQKVGIPSFNLLERLSVGQEMFTSLCDFE